MPNDIARKTAKAVFCGIYRDRDRDWQSMATGATQTVFARRGIGNWELGISNKRRFVILFFNYVRSLHLLWELGIGNLELGKKGIIIKETIVVCEMPKRIKRKSSSHAVQEAGKKIAQAAAVKGASLLRVHGFKNRYAVPSCTVLHHNYVVHLSPSNSRNSCTCDAHKIHRIRPCKHVLALKFF